MTDQKEYGKCLCPSCYVLSCANRKKPKKTIETAQYEKHFDKLDSF